MKGIVTHLLTVKVSIPRVPPVVCCSNRCFIFDLRHQITWLFVVSAISVTACLASLSDVVGA